MRRPGRLDRRLLCWLTRRIYSARTSTPPGPEGTGGLLLVRGDERMGNLLLLQPMLDSLRAASPGLELGLWVAARMEPLVRRLEGVDRLHLIDRRWFLRDGPRWRAAIGEVRRQAYPAAIDASAWHEVSFTHAALTYFSGAAMRVGFDREGASAFYTHPVAPGPVGEHELEQRARLLHPFGLVEGATPRLRTALGVERRERWRAWLQQLQVNRPRVGLWPGARKPDHRWPLPYFVQLGRRLQERQGANLVVLWGPGEESLRDPLASALKQAVVSTPAIDADDLAGLLRCLDLVVANDTGPMHLAVAARVPTVAVFTQPDGSRWGHPYPQVRNLHLPGREPAEVEQAALACSELLSTGRSIEAADG